MTDPTFTAVMPAYNAARTIDAAIRSVLAQTRQDFELVVVDDGSTDATAARVQAYDDARIRLIHQENRGLAAARNAAIVSARGRYVSMIDSDDMWLPLYLDRMAAVLDADGGAAFAYTDGWVLDDRTRRIRRSTAMQRQRPPEPPPREASAFLAELLDRNFVFGLTTVRRAVLEEVGGYDVALRSAEDYELWLRILSRGYRATRAPGLLVVMRDRPGSLSHNEDFMLVCRREVYRKVAEEYDVPQEIKAIARAKQREFERELAAFRGESRLHAALMRARWLGGRVKRRLLDRRLWLETPPPEVAAAFPDLHAV